jgi:hypothetical protein
MTQLVRSQYRLPVDVDNWLKQEADRDGRSKNSMLVAALRQVMRQRNGNAPAAGTDEALIVTK